MDCSSQGSSVHGISLARILEWMPFPTPGDLPDPGIEPLSPTSPALQVVSLSWHHLGSPLRSLTIPYVLFQLESQAYQTGIISTLFSSQLFHSRTSQVPVGYINTFLIDIPVCKLLGYRFLDFTKSSTFCLPNDSFIYCFVFSYSLGSYSFITFYTFSCCFVEFL